MFGMLVVEMFYVAGASCLCRNFSSNKRVVCAGIRLLSFVLWVARNRKNLFAGSFIPIMSVQLLCIENVF